MSAPEHPDAPGVPRPDATDGQPEHLLATTALLMLPVCGWLASTTLYRCPDGSWTFTGLSPLLVVIGAAMSVGLFLVVAVVS